MVFWVEQCAQIRLRDFLNDFGILAVGATTLLLAFALSSFVALCLGEPTPLRLSALMRQGYGPAWILNLGFLVWGCSILSMSLRPQGVRRGAMRLGLLLMGGGFFALALWSAAPLDGEPVGSSVEARLHGAYLCVLLTGFALASGTSALRMLSRPHEGLVSGVALTAVSVLSALASLFPALTTFAELCSLWVICSWCVWWAGASSEKEASFGRYAGSGRNVSA